MPSRLHNFYTLSPGQLHTSTNAEGEFVHMKTPPIFIRGIGTQSHRWRGAQHHIAIGPDPIPMPMAVEHEDTRGMGASVARTSGALTSARPMRSRSLSYPPDARRRDDGVK